MARRVDKDFAISQCSLPQCVLVFACAPHLFEWGLLLVSRNFWRGVCPALFQSINKGWKANILHKNTLLILILCLSPDKIPVVLKITRAKHMLKSSKTLLTRETMESAASNDDGIFG